MTPALRDAARAMDDYGARGIPFLFIIDFEGVAPLALPLDSIDPNEIRYAVGNRSNATGSVPARGGRPVMEKRPLSFEAYRAAFDRVVAHQRAGDSYLANLTFPTAVRIPLSLAEVFHRGRAPYRLWYRDRFTVFSPETFITIADGRLATHPMKGTIRADVPDAAARLLADEKELAEHVTVVDLLRNDCAMVARNVRVERFRYIDRVTTHAGDLLQMSSHITGELPAGYAMRIGEIITTLLPAGSVSGAPKRRTLEIIREAEGAPRGYYTGVFGIFDGKHLDSAVMIRFLERRDDGLYYRSGGGITVYSDAAAEYQELIDKVYVPIV